ncbi:terpenoid synthase [Amniculicola lignicola CBS 123094]|uniref:Terpene synthase n=1 Tax=Amniculicola lignicola CBS 123094 TaxID=1392246 RepID=A0A6A5WM93_9PLEO|nr:terpenoid synthase [Amniculicola lignicola CBS 123094]
MPQWTVGPLQYPKNSRLLPPGLSPTLYTARKHAQANALVASVNGFFLTHWPFKTDDQRQRFVNEGYAWFVCVNCPMSLDDRLHWGCRLLTLGFLIDDLLDRMNLSEGVAYNTKVIECGRGTAPDRNVPAQWIMYDLFDEMRKVDRILADQLLEQTIDFLKAQVDKDRHLHMELNEYFQYRDADLGKGLLSGIMRFCASLHMTPEELALAAPIEELAMKHITFVNDIASFEKELLSAKEGFELGAICSSVPIVMDMCEVGVREAKRMMWQMVRAWEIEHFVRCKVILKKHPSKALEKCFKGLEYQASGNEVWTLMTPRYRTPGEKGYEQRGAGTGAAVQLAELSGKLLDTFKPSVGVGLVFCTLFSLVVMLWLVVLVKQG